MFHRGGVPRHHVSKKNGAEARSDRPAAARSAGRSNRLSQGRSKTPQKGCLSESTYRQAETVVQSQISAKLRSRRASARGARCGPRLAQDAEKTLLSGCVVEGMYQGPTYQLYMHLWHVWPPPRCKNHSAVHLDGFLSSSREQWGGSCSITRIFEKTVLTSRVPRRVVRDALRGRSLDVPNPYERSPEMLTRWLNRCLL